MAYVKYEKMIFDGYELYLLRHYITEWRRLDEEILHCRNEQAKIHHVLFSKEVEENKLAHAQRKAELEINRIISENKNFYSDKNFTEGENE